MVTKEHLMNMLTMDHKSYRLLICTMALDFLSWSARVDGLVGHHFLGHRVCPITCTFLMLLALSGCTSYQVGFFEMTLLFFFHHRLSLTSLYFLIHSPLRFVAMLSTKNNCTSLYFCRYTKFVFQTKSKTS